MTLRNLRDARPPPGPARKFRKPGPGRPRAGGSVLGPGQAALPGGCTDGPGPPPPPPPSDRPDLAREQPSNPDRILPLIAGSTSGADEVPSCPGEVLLGQERWVEDD